MRHFRYKLILLPLLFVVSFFVLSDLSTREKGTLTSERMASTLPLVKVKEGQVLYNDLHGYRQYMNMSTIKRTVTLTDEPKVSFSIEQNGNRILSVAYELYDSKGELLETNTLNDNNLDESSEGLHIHIDLETLSNANEYQMVLVITTKEMGVVKYYTRLLYGTHFDIEDTFEVIKSFHNGTFEKVAPDKEPYIKRFLRNSSNITTPTEFDLGQVNLSSPIETILWDPLEMVKMHEPIPRVIDINDTQDVITYQLKYVAASRRNNHLFYYNVMETYKLRKREVEVIGEDKQIVDRILDYDIIDFERNLHMILDKNMMEIEDGNLNFSYMSQDNQSLIKTSQNGQYYVILHERQLWLYDKKQNYKINIFAFDQLNSDYVLDTYEDHEIQILDIDNEGNVTYVVIGYMNTGAYEGYNGVLINVYEHKQQVNNSLAFIPFEVAFSDLQYHFDYFNYLNGEGKWFFIYRDKLYMVDLKEKRYEVIHSDLPIEKENLLLSQESSMIAWQEKADRYNQNVYLVNLETIESYVIESGTDQRIKVLGFMNNNAVIGYADVEHLFLSLDGALTFPMKYIEIHNEQNEIVKRYEPGNQRLVTNYSIESSRLNLERSYRIQTNALNPTDNKIRFEPAEGDFIVYTRAVEEERHALIPRTNEAGYVEYILPISQPIMNSSDYSMAKQKLNHATGILNIDFGGEQPPHTYKVYANNRLIYYTDDLSLAIKEAKIHKGKVYNYEHRLVWEDIERVASSKIITGIPVIPQYPVLPRGCEVVSLTMLLNYYGIEVDRMTLADEIRYTEEPYRIVNNMVSFGDMHQGFVGNMHTTSEPGIGAYHEPVQELMGQYVEPEKILNLTGTHLEDLLYYVDQEMPIWINVANNYDTVPDSRKQHWLTPNGIMEISFTEHAVLIVGYDNEFIYYNDPSRAIRDRKPRQQFENAFDQYARQALVYIGDL
jgi:uncharacterized protein YvpB